MRRHPHRQQRDALHSSNQMKKRQLADDPSPSIGKLVARMAVRKALRTVPEIRFRTAYVLGFKLPELRDKQFFETALKNELACHFTNKGPRHFGPDFFYFLGRADRPKNRRRGADEASQLLEELDENQRMIGVSTPENPMTSQFKEIAEAIIEAPIESRFIKAALHIAHDIHICDKTAERLLSYTLSELTLAFRGNRPLNAALRFLEGLRGASTLAQQEQNGSADVRDLSQSHGYGKAKVWGLELAQDFRDLKAGTIQWSDVDRGILLRGDTGTGKTTFAKSLAKSCGAVLVECSLTKSQALGHLGDMLRGLNKAFKDARSKAPSILFFDEFDSIGNRETLSRHAPEYATQVINGVLDLMDGLESRESVVIVAACNRIDTIDSAFLRPGRLERVVELPLPDLEARKGIFTQHLQARLPDEDLQDVAELTDGWSGAKLEGLARECRRAARRSGKTLDSRLVRAVWMTKFDQVPAETLERSAVHEAGHVVAAFEMIGVVPTQAALRKYQPIDRSDDAGSGGHVMLPERNLGSRVQSDYLDEIAVLLAGQVAETLLLGEPSDGAGLARGSDLERATYLAACLIASSGLGRHLTFRSEISVPAIRRLIDSDRAFERDCDQILQSQKRRSTALLRTKKRQLRAISDSLLRSNILSAEQISEILISNQVR